MQRRDLKAEIIAMAAQDAAFRAELLRDPRAAISGRFGVPLPSGLNIRVVEDTAAQVTIALPLCGQVPEGMLDAVAGGASSCINDSIFGLASGPNG